MAKEKAQAKDKDQTDTGTAFERVQLARHPERPYTLDFVERMFENFTEIHGDRRFADDPAIVCGFATFHGMPMLIVGHQKGRDTKQRQYRNFGMPKPEGYRTANLAMKLGGKFERPVLSFISTPVSSTVFEPEATGEA